ncbi:MAG: hypothetical protein KAS72_01065 [Phycisphaerales bacterium]|nr:hypothetical protein [Phycisphaerales bacterium]
MPIIKHTQAEPKFRSAIVLDLGDLRKQADVIHAEAKQRAEAVIRKGADEARRLTEGAAERGFAEGKVAGYEAGYQAGLEQGRTEAREELHGDLLMLLDQWSKALAHLEEDRDQILRQAREDVLRLALAIARRVTVAAAAQAPETIVEQAVKAIALITQPSELRITVNPTDVDRLEQALPQLAERFTASRHASITADSSITSGGCIVAYGKGMIDATIDTQIRRLVNALHPQAEDGDGDTPDSTRAPDDPSPSDAGHGAS